MPYDPMKPTGKVKGNLELFKILERQAKPDYKEKIREISRLYRERKIANNITAYNLIQKLASKNALLACMKKQSKSMNHQSRYQKKDCAKKRNLRNRSLK